MRTRSSVLRLAVLLGAGCAAGSSGQVPSSVTQAPEMAASDPGTVSEAASLAVSGAVAPTAPEATAPTAPEAAITTSTQPADPIFQGWAGVPLRQLGALGLGEPEVDAYGSGWQAPLLVGGFVRATLFSDAAAAHEGFVFQSGSLANVALTDFSKQRLLRGTADVEAVGDGAQLLLVRDRNVVFAIRDHSGHALDVARSVQAALTRTVPEGWVDERTLSGESWRWDACGWRHKKEK
jgi:hypothetical protein